MKNLNKPEWANVEMGGGINVEVFKRPLKGVRLNYQKSWALIGPKQKCIHCGKKFFEKHDCSPEIAFRRRYQQFVSGAKGKSSECTISLEHYKMLKNALFCYYCGITKGQYRRIVDILKKTDDKPTVFHGTILKNYFSTWHIERLNPLDGYVEDNVVPACAFCNGVKGRLLDVDQMLLLRESMRKRLLGLLDSGD